MSFHWSAFHLPRTPTAHCFLPSPAPWWKHQASRRCFSLPCHLLFPWRAAFWAGLSLTLPCTLWSPVPEVWFLRCQTDSLYFPAQDGSLSFCWCRNVVSPTTWNPFTLSSLSHTLPLILCPDASFGSFTAAFSGFLPTYIWKSECVVFLFSSCARVMSCGRFYLLCLSICMVFGGCVDVLGSKCPLLSWGMVLMMKRKENRVSLLLPLN